MKQVGTLIRLLVPVFLLACCASRYATNRPAVGDRHDVARCYYTVKSSVRESGIPHKVYLFPPLPADIHGKPSEKLVPLQDGHGNVCGWKPPSSLSRALRESAALSLRSKGYEVVEFKDVLGMNEPHSILVVSMFYHMPAAGVEAGKDGRKFILTMIRARTFDADLDLSRCHAVSDVDGNTRFEMHDDVNLLMKKTFGSLVWHIGDNASGYVVLP